MFNIGFIEIIDQNVYFRVAEMHVQDNMHGYMDTNTGVSD